MIRRRGWISLVFTGLLLLAAIGAVAEVDLEEALKDAPQQIHDIIAMNEGPLNEGEFLIIGKVSFSDARLIEGGDCPEVYVAFQCFSDRALLTLPGGWYVTEYPIESYCAEGALLVLRAVGHRPVDVTITATVENPIILVEDVVLVPEADYAITGVVYDAEGGPIPGLTVDLTFALSSYCYEPLQSTVTDAQGAFGFSDLSSAAHRVTLGAPHGFIAARLDVEPHKPDVDEVVELTMYPRLQIVIDYVYQPNGTRTLTGPDVITGTATWRGTQGFDFEDGAPEYYESEDLRDLELSQIGGELFFRSVYVNGENGHYRVADASFDDVIEAAESGYGISRAPCVVGGVYVVRTYSELHYAKFIVRAIEPEP